MRLPIFIASAVLFIQCQTTPYQFSGKSTAHILKTLSADEMRGRHAFTPDIEKAADFIAGEFKRAGLQALSNQNDYRQKFNIYSITIDEANFNFRNATVKPDQFFVLADNNSIEWTSDKDAAIIELGKDADFRAEFGKIRNMDGEVLVFADPSHKDIFIRYQRFFSRASRTFPNEQNGNKVFVLANKPPNKNFKISISKNVETIEMANVAGMIKGNRTDEYVLFSAHYDHIGIRPVQEAGTDSIANGANDNASGTTAVIELARYFKSLDKPERTLVFVAFTAEESGGYGSQYFSRQFDPEKIMAMFNIEMIGKPAVEGPNTAWITGFDKSTFGELLQKSAEGTIYEFYPDPYPTQNLFYRSDNATLARLGVPAHTISTTPIDVDPDYHQVSDEFETIDVAHLTNTIKAISKAAVGIVSGKDTPTRVNTSELN